jgi:serine phosphatase RsbU (regulator of sigma subunit)/PAS domain-containing protein
MVGGPDRTALLARASELLEAPLDPAVRLQRIVELTVPALGDLATIDLLDGRGAFDGTLVHGTDPERVALLRRMRREFPLDAGGTHPIAIAARSGVPVLIDDVAEDLLADVAESPEHLSMLRRLSYGSSVIVPLVSRGRRLGVLAAIRDRGGAPLGDAELELARELVRRVAGAVDVALLLDELRRSEGQLETIVANLAEAVGAFGPDGSWRFANARAAELLGCATVDELLATPAGELLGAFTLHDERAGRVAPEDLPLAAAFRGAVPEPLTVRLVDRRTGRERWVIFRAEPVRDDTGRLELVVGTAEDVTAVKREEVRQRFLSTATKLLSSSLEVDATVDKAAWAAVPELADWARIDLPDERGELREAAIAHRDLGKAELLREWRRDFPPDDDARTPVGVFASGVPAVWADVGVDDYVRHARSPRHEALMREIGTRSMLVVPMLAGGRTVGTLQLATTHESGRRLGFAEVDLALELAERAAIAVEHARVHAERTRVAVTLQRSLLPPRLPVIPGVTVAARFRAAGGATTDVGGDFYDLFRVKPPGEEAAWLVLVGDVTGKGPEAAAVTSLARHTARTAALYEPEPGRVLARMDAALADDGGRRLCTAVCALVRPRPGGSATVEIACAGHPRPYVLDAAGGLREAGGAGPLLGAFADGRWPTDAVELGEGDGLVLFTDGVTDARGRDGRFGTAGLEAVLAGLEPGRAADDVAGTIDAALRDFEVGDQRDDVALLVLRAGADEGASVVAQADPPAASDGQAG